MGSISDLLLIKLISVERVLKIRRIKRKWVLENNEQYHFVNLYWSFSRFIGKKWA